MRVVRNAKSVHRCWNHCKGVHHGFKHARVVYRYGSFIENIMVINRIYDKLGDKLEFCTYYCYYMYISCKRRTLRSKVRESFGPFKPLSFFKHLAMKTTLHVTQYEYLEPRYTWVTCTHNIPSCERLFVHRRTCSFTIDRWVVEPRVKKLATSM